MAEDVVYIVLVGAGGLITITATTYLMAYLVDRTCSSPYPTDRVFSPVSNRAGLWGLGHQERTDVLDRLFKNEKLICSYDGNKMKKLDQPVEIEMTDFKKRPPRDNHGVGGNETTTENESETMGPEFDIERPAALDCVSPIDRSLIDAEEVQQNTLCSICLVEYENGVKVMTGMHCSHLYHVSCIMEWMQKGHDYCPFCRKLMMTPEAMRMSAIQVLGEARVGRLARPDVPAIVDATTQTQENAPASNVSLPAGQIDGEAGQAVSPQEEPQRSSRGQEEPTSTAVTPDSSGSMRVAAGEEPAVGDGATTHAEHVSTDQTESITEGPSDADSEREKRKPNFVEDYDC